MHTPSADLNLPFPLMPRPFNYFSFFTFATVCAASANDAGMEFFENKIRPVLVAECYECHGAKKQKGGLRLDFRDGWKKGGESGDAIVPGEPAKGLLLSSIRQRRSGPQDAEEGAKTRRRGHR